MARWKARIEFLLSVIELLFLSLTVEVLQGKMCQKFKTNVELHPKLKLTIILKFKENYSFTTILLHIPVCVLVEKTTN